MENGMNIRMIITVLFLPVFVLIAEKGYYYKERVMLPDPVTKKTMTTTIERYVTKDKVKIVNPDNFIIITKSKIYNCNEASKSYYVRNIADLSKEGLTTDRQIEDFTITDTGHKLVLGNWKAKRYRASFKLMEVPTSIDYYISTDEEYPMYIFTKEKELLYPVSTGVGKMAVELNKIGGFIIKTETVIEDEKTMMKTITEMVEIKKRDFNKDTFKVPEDYRLLDI